MLAVSYPLSQGLDDRPPLISRSGFATEYHPKIIVTHTDSVDDIRGAHREFWYRYVNTEGFATLRENPIFEQKPDGYTTMQSLSAIFEVSENYGERLSSYLQVIFPPVSLNCSFICRLFR